MNKKGVFGLTSIRLFFASILVIALISYLIITIFGTLSDSDIIPQQTLSSTNSLVYSTPTTLSPVGEGISSSTLTTPNQTYLFFLNNDYVRVSSDEAVSITFWYKNLTSNWIFISNVSGTTYVNAVLGNPIQYPVYFNGSDYFIGKINSTKFFNGSIDDFRVYDYELNTTMINDIYTGGRK